MDILEALRESNNILGNDSQSNIVINNQNAVYNEPNDFVDINVGVETNVAVDPTNDPNVAVQNVELDLSKEKDEKERKFYQLLYSNKDFQKKLVENKSIIRRKKEHFELIDEIRNAYNKLTNGRTRREKYLFSQYAVLNIDG